MDTRKARRLDRNGDVAGAGADSEEAEEKGQWEGRERTMTG